MKNLILGICVLILASLASCKVDVDPTTDINTVVFSIKIDNEGESLVKGAKVFVYSSEDAYKTAYAKYDTTGKTADTTLVATEGKFSLDLNSKKTYWVRVLYSKDTTEAFISGKVPYSNDEMPVQFGPFESNNFDGTKINTNATITLSKAYSFLLVAAKDTSNINVEVYNSIGKECLRLSGFSQLSNSGILDTSNLPRTKDLLNKTSSKYLIFVVPKGKIKIYYINSFGCASIVEKYISGSGSIEKDLLEPCTNGNIVFYNTSNFTDVKIIILNPNDTIGTLTSKSSNAPTCNTTSVSNSYIKVSRSLGEYRYIATSKSCNCEIPGVVKLSYVGQCMPVEISMK